jgi:hypothetical protein
MVEEPRDGATPSRKSVTVEKTECRNGTLKLLVAHNGDVCRRLRAAFEPVGARVVGLLVTLAHPFPARDAFASRDSSPHRFVEPGANAVRSVRSRDREHLALCCR